MIVLQGNIYCYTNLINGKKYVGQTVNLELRKRAHKSAAQNENSDEYNSPLHRAFRKYGYENFSYEVLEENIDNYEELNAKEIEYIAQFNSQTPNGYNVEPGGKNCSKPKSEEQREKLMYAQAALTEEEVIELRKAYVNKESPTKIYNEKYKDRMHYNSFLNIWSGRKYKFIMPEVIQTGRHTKLNAELVREIKLKRKEEGTSYQKLADEFNVSKSTIADIFKGRTWKDVQI